MTSPKNLAIPRPQPGQTPAMSPVHADHLKASPVPVCLLRVPAASHNLAGSNFRCCGDTFADRRSTVEDFAGFDAGCILIGLGRDVGTFEDVLSGAVWTGETRGRY